MSTVGVAQSLRLVVVLREAERGIGAVGSVVIKQLVDRLQHSLGFMPRDSALAPQVGLQIRHQQSAGNSFSCNIAQHQSEAFLA